MNYQTQISDFPIDVLAVIVTKIDSGSTYKAWSFTCSRFYHATHRVYGKRSELANHLCTVYNITKNDIKWNYAILSQTPDIKWEIVCANPDDNWNYHYLSRNSDITWEIISANPDKEWNGNMLSLNSNITLAERARIARGKSYPRTHKYHGIMICYPQIQT